MIYGGEFVNTNNFGNGKLTHIDKNGKVTVLLKNKSFIGNNELTIYSNLRGKLIFENFHTVAEHSTATKMTGIDEIEVNNTFDFSMDLSYTLPNLKKIKITNTGFFGSVYSLGSLVDLSITDVPCLFEYGLSYMSHIEYIKLHLPNLKIIPYRFLGNIGKYTKSLNLSFPSAEYIGHGAIQPGLSWDDRSKITLEISDKIQMIYVPEIREAAIKVSPEVLKQLKNSSYDSPVTRLEPGNLYINKNCKTLCDGLSVPFNNTEGIKKFATSEAEHAVVGFRRLTDIFSPFKSATFNKLKTIKVGRVGKKYLIGTLSFIPSNSEYISFPELVEMDWVSAYGYNNLKRITLPKLERIDNKAKFYKPIGNNKAVVEDLTIKYPLLGACPNLREITCKQWLKDYLLEHWSKSKSEITTQINKIQWTIVP